MRDHSSTNPERLAAGRPRRLWRRPAGAAVGTQLAACGNSGSQSQFPAGSSTTSQSGSSSNNTGIFGDGGGNTLGDGAVVPFTTKNDCPHGGTTTMTGRVLDPAGKNPVFNATVFVRDTSVPLPDVSKVAISCG